MKTPLKVVMISSTARNLPEHRTEIRLGFERAGFEPHVMEHLPALDADAIKASSRDLIGRQAEHNALTDWLAKSTDPLTVVLKLNARVPIAKANGAPVQRSSAAISVNDSKPYVTNDC
jgi:hypothetical protein